MATANEQLLNSAKELSNEFVQEKDAINDYKSKIEELKSIIDDNSSSYDKVSQARKDLMVVQDELIKKFGTEKETIDIITNAINDQSNALDELTKKQYQQWKNNFNDKSFAQSASDFLSSDNIGNAIYKLTEFDFSGAWEMLTAPTESNIDKMVDSMRYAYYKIEKTGNDTLDSLIAKTYDLYDDGSNFILDGNLDDIYEDLLEIQNLANDFDVSDSFETSITKVANAMDKTLKSYKEAYDTYILYEKILNESNTNQYDEQFNLINKAKEAYDNAVVSGNQNKIEEASDEYAKTLQSAIDLAMGNYDYDVADYFKAMYPELQQMFGEWQFTLSFEPNTDGLQDKVADALDSIDGVSDGTTSFSVEDIENFNPNVATQEQIDAYGELTNVAETYGLTVKQLIALLQTMGLIQSESYQQLVDTFGQDNVDKLSPEDLEIAYKIENVGNMTFEQLQTEIEKTKQQTNETGISPLSISQTIDQLNTQLKPAFDSLQSAYQDIFTDDGKFDLNSIDILSTCDTIKSKLDEMSDPEGLNLDVDYSAFEDFVRVLNNTESTEQDVENAFDSLATSITQAALSGTEDFETMKAALEDLGVVNETIIAFQALAENTDALKESGLDLENATYAQLQAFAQEKLGAEDAAQGVAILVYQQMLVAENPLDTMASIQALANLGGKAAETAGILAELAQIMAQISNLQTWMANNPGADASLVEATLGGLERKAEKLKSQIYTGVDFENVGGGTSSASKAGSKAADAYLEAFQKEYDHLKDLLDRGEISEAQYLNRLRSLYTRYFKDRKEYLDEYKKYESEYLSGMLNLHNKALSGISTLLGNKISAANDAKDAAISALEEEKEAAEEAYQAQIDAIEEEKDAIDGLIKEKDKKIDALNEEADAIQKSAETRKKNIDLQKEEYNLERMLNQRTTAVYKEGKGFVFEADTSGIRDAREKVKEAKEELEIDRLQREADLIQKEIDLLEEKKDALTEEQEAIQKMIDESNKYYDNLIKQQEKMWDSMIKGMEQQKSKWEELADIQEIAEAYSAVQQVFGDLGYTVEDVLNGSDAAFEDFKSHYISLISDVNSNSDFTEGLVYATGVAKENLGSFLDKTKETAEGLDELGGKGSEMDSVAESMDKLSDSATTASTSTGEIASNMGELNTNTEGLSDNLNGIGDALTGIPEADKFDTLTTSFTNLGDAIKGVASALGVGEEGTVGGLVGALQELSGLSLGEEDTGILSQFNNLKTAVEGVTSAISGGGSSGGQSGDASGSSSASMSAGAGGGSASGLVGAIEDFKSATDEALGGGGESGEGEGSGSGGTGAIPQFKELKTAVDDVTTAIGSGDAEGGESSGDGESDNLIGSIVNLGETSTETLGESDGDGIIGKFNEFKGVIEEAANQVKSISEGLDEIDGKEVECTITVNVKMNGSIPAFASGTVLGNMQIESATYNAQYGKAFANGTIGLKHDEKNALRSEYGQPELTVYPNGTTELTTSPVMSDLPKGTVIYNEEETKKIMDNKSNPVGNAHADGTDDSIWTTLADGTKVRDLQPGDKMYDLYQKFDAYFKSIDGNLEKLVPNSFYEHNRQMNEVANFITNSSIVNNNHRPSVNIGDINVTCPGVTSQQVAEQLGSVIGKELDKQFNGFHNYTDQRSRMR